MCYKSKSEFGGTTAHLDDDSNPASPGGANAFHVKKTKDLCIPASAVTSGVDVDHDILDPNDLLVFYSAKRAAGHCTSSPATACKKDEECGANGPCVLDAKFDKKAARYNSRRILDDYIDLRFNFSKEIGVLAPARTGGTAPAAGSADFYKCYGVKAAKASCAGGTNEGAACKDSTTCTGGGTCTPNLKFPKELFPDGLVAADVDDAFLSGSTRESFKKVKMACQVASKNSEAELHPGSALLCYSVKPIIGPDFVPPAAQTISTAFGANDFVEVKKPEMFCNPACIEPPALSSATFNNLVLKANSLQLGVNTNVGEALDIDGDTTRDNALAPFAGLVNGLLADEVEEGGLLLLFSLDGLGNGAHIVSGYTAEQATPPNCTDVNDAAQLCDYEVSQSALEITDTCAVGAEIQLPVNLAGNTAIGGGPGTKFSISFSVGDGGQELQVTAQNVKVDATFTEVAGPDVTTIQGVIGGAVPYVDFIEAISGLSECSDSSTNAGASCSASTECPSGSCIVFDPIDIESVQSLLGAAVDPDIDLDGVMNCIRGNNHGEVCTSNDDCPDPTAGSENGDQACVQHEAISLGIKFTAIDANIVGVAD
ncbi:MAG TPA: hypothetical protein VEB21_03735 [Terriglobales bacterium]|nr:hypothetical protein [Terriglobales bacterium]